MTRRLNMPRVKTQRTPIVTDHALLRYLERYLQVDMEAVRASILTPSVVEAIRCGATAVHCPAEGMTLIVSEAGAIKTVLPLKKRRAGEPKRGLA